MEEYVKHLDNVIKIIKRLLHTRNVDYEILDYGIVNVMFYLMLIA